MRKAAIPAAAILLAVMALILFAQGDQRDAEAGSGCTASAICVKSALDNHNPPHACDDTCTLRDALGAADAGDDIEFDIPGGGVQTITVDPAKGELTVINNSVTINGYTQPGAHANSISNTADNPTALGKLMPGNADIRIVLQGSAALSYGLWLKGAGALIEGLSIVGFEDEGIFVSTFAQSETIQGNYIGILPDGHTPVPNGVGVHVRSSEPSNLIGGSQPAQRNVISGNEGAGIWITGGDTTDLGVVISGNFIGTNDAGTAAVPNDVGILMAGGPASTIGGNSTATANLISGNTHDGIVLSTSEAAHMNIKGNRIGVKGDSVTPLPNGGAGVLLTQGAFDNTIGGEFNAGEQNVIAYNGGAGVGLTVSAGVDNYIDPNHMYSNVGLGADLKNDGQPLPNDAGDLDGGNDGGSEHTNRLMNYPIVTNATYDKDLHKLTVDATLDTVPGHYYNMFFFWNEECDPSGYGEAQHFLGSLGVNGNAPMPYQFNRDFTVSLAGTVYVVTSASDPESSSEFSPCYAVDTGVPVTPTARPTDTIGPTPTLTPTHSPTPTPTHTAAPTHSATPTPTPTATPTHTAAPTLIQGDMDCDGQITMQDFTQFMAYLALGERGPAPSGCPYPGDPFFPAVYMDTNCSYSPTPAPGTTPPAAGYVDTQDALSLLTELSGIHHPFSCIGRPLN
jgi:hypothetical protein